MRHMGGDVHTQQVTLISYTISDLLLFCVLAKALLKTYFDKHLSSNVYLLHPGAPTESHQSIQCMRSSVQK